MSEFINQVSSINQRRRYTYLFLGLVFVATSVLMAVFAFQTIQYFFAVLIFILGALLMGMFFSFSPKILSEGEWTYKSSRSYREPVTAEINFVSIPWTRFYAAILLLTIGILDYFFLGAYFGPPEDIPVEQFHGTALTLGNMSFFWLVGFPPLMIGTGMLIYSIFSSYPGTIARSENIFYVHERRILFPKLTEIAKTEVEGIRFQNTNIGHRIIWVIWFIPTSLLMLKYGVPMFDEPRAATHEFPIMMTLTAVFNIICLILLVVHPQNYMELVTKEKYYEMWFNPQHKSDKIQILEILNYGRGTVEGRGGTNFEDLKDGKEDLLITRENQKKYFRLFLGILILIVSVLSYAFQVLFGALFWFGGTVFGVGMIITAFLTDFNTTQQVFFDQSTGKFLLNSTYGGKNASLGAFKAKAVSLTPHLRRLKPFEVLSAMWISGIALIQTIYTYVYGDFSRWILIIEAIGTTVITLSLIFLFFLYFCVPINHLRIESETFTYYYELPQNEEKWGPLKNPFKKLMKSRQLIGRLIFGSVILLISAGVSIFYIFS